MGLGNTWKIEMDVDLVLGLFLMAMTLPPVCGMPIAHLQVLRALKSLIVNGLDSTEMLAVFFLHMVFLTD